MPKRKNFIVRRYSDLNTKGNFSIARNDFDEIEIFNKPPSGYWQKIHLKDSRAARMLSKRLNQFLDAGG